jgi:hypothetical protein
MIFVAGTPVEDGLAPSNRHSGGDRPPWIALKQNPRAQGCCLRVDALYVCSTRIW